MSLWRPVIGLLISWTTQVRILYQGKTHTHGRPKKLIHSVFPSLYTSSILWCIHSFIRSFIRSFIAFLSHPSMKSFRSCHPFIHPFPAFFSIQRSCMGHVQRRRPKLPSLGRNVDCIVPCSTGRGAMEAELNSS